MKRFKKVLNGEESGKDIEPSPEHDNEKSQSHEGGKVPRLMAVSPSCRLLPFAEYSGEHGAETTAIEAGKWPKRLRP